MNARKTIKAVAKLLLQRLAEQRMARGSELPRTERSQGMLDTSCDRRVFKKIFNATPDGRASFEAETRFALAFANYDWMPEVVESKDLSISYEWISPVRRLDLLVPVMSKKHRKKVARQAAKMLFDIHAAGYAHRDIHVRNMFWTKGRIRLVDFESSISLDNETGPFSESYDMVGAGPASPHNTQRMCWSKDSGVALGRQLDVDVTSALAMVREDLIDNLRASSSTFNTKLKRHSCKTNRVYGSFRLPGFEVLASEAQRNSEKRCVRFGIKSADIAGRNILDLGSNVGAMLFELQKYEPNFSLGVEIDQEKVDVSEHVKAFAGLKGVEFKQSDIDTLEASDVGGSADVVICLAIERHVQSPERLFRLLGDVTKEKLYFEGNEGTDVSFVEMQLEANGFASVKYIGESDDDIIVRNNCRPLFVAQKKP